MRIALHIGPDPWVSARIQDILANRRTHLARKGVLYPASPGKLNHTRLFMAVCKAGGLLRHTRGFGPSDAQLALRAEVTEALAQEVAASRPDMMILSAHQFGAHLTDPAELDALHAMLAPLGGEIRVVAHVFAPSEMARRAYAVQVLDGRSRSLELELRLARAPDWAEGLRASTPGAAPERGVFPDMQAAPLTPDLAHWAALWEHRFGQGSLRLRAADEPALTGEAAGRWIAAQFDLDLSLGQVKAIRPPALPSAQWLARARQVNDMMLRLRAREPEHHVPRQLWRKILGDLRCPGPEIARSDLAALDARFGPDIADLAHRHPTLASLPLLSAADSTPFAEPPPREGFRATQALLAHLPRIERATEAARAEAAAPKAPQATHLPPQVQKNLKRLRSSSFAPHNRLGHIDEETLAAPFVPMPPRSLAPGTSGTVIVGCMKNEAPYIVEWVAYHRAIGVDNFLIYTNGCEDGTAEILERLQALGIVQHRDNNAWSGKSPQQHALNAALREPLIEQADWIIHIDVDEFINVRCGNGTLPDFLDRVPGATNVAMTWRLFGHNGITALSDAPVIAQFEACAPRFCPKPHTVWGFKTMTRNIGAYAKLSCHRPNKLDPDRAGEVHWVNGSGQPMGDEVKKNGWRNSKRSIGYDLLQLNHYALRSAESFLVKRQRGRALHVDRSIGLNYWIRMDWSGARDVTIQRNLPRMMAERARLLSDPELARLQADGLAWHRAKAAELRAQPDFADLYEQALGLQLTETERVAYALALDMET